MKQLPKKINICGINYKILYFDKLIQVDEEGREPLYGQIIFADRAIRIYKGDRDKGDILQTLLHEIMHGIDEHLGFSIFDNYEQHKKMDAIIKSLVDTMIRNGMIKGL
jgi:hypothetical protein